MPNDNIFKEALELLSTKKGPEMSEEELQLINTAIIPLMVTTNGVLSKDSIEEGLGELAKIVEEANRETVAVSRGRVVGYSPGP